MQRLAEMKMNKRNKTETWLLVTRSFKMHIKAYYLLLKLIVLEIFRKYWRLFTIFDFTNSSILKTSLPKLECKKNSLI